MNPGLLQSDALTTRLDLIHSRLDLINTRLDLIHTRLDLIHWMRSLELFSLCRLRWWGVPRAATTSSCPRFYARTKTINSGIVPAVQVAVVGGPQGGHHQLLPQVLRQDQNYRLWNCSSLCRLRWWGVPRAATTSSCPRFYARTKTIDSGIVLPCAG